MRVESISFAKSHGGPAGSVRGWADIEAAQKERVARGMSASEVFHGSPFSSALASGAGT